MIQLDRMVGQTWVEYNTQCQVVRPSARTRRRHTAKIQRRMQACARRDQARQLKQSMAQMRATCKKHSQ